MRALPPGEEEGEFIEDEGHHGKADALDDSAKQEASPMTQEEKHFYDKAMQALTPDQRKHMMEDPLDGLVIVRGYQTFTPREQETAKFMKLIADWRDKVGYYQLFDKRLDQHHKFHSSWPNKIYGNDKFGHVLTAFRVAELKPDALEEIGQDQLEKLQGQKMRCVYRYKQEQSKLHGAQRYKHSALMDMKGLSLNLMRGKKREILQHLLGIGSHYFPEQMWKIYLINTPIIFRGMWAIIKLWLHPVTVAKVNIVGNEKAAVKKMTEDGIPLSALPDWIGGKNKGWDMAQMVEQYIDQK